MKAIARVLFIFCTAIGTAHSTEVWDGLPALEPTHLQGAYTGRRICPMCTHGYDAGIMVFASASTSTENIRTLAKNLRPTTLGISSDRFRVFVIVTGEPSAQQLKTLAYDDPRWFVASLKGAALENAERELGRSIRQGTWGYVFAQRRLLRLFSEKELYGANAEELKAQSNYAMRLLEALHPSRDTSADPDVPKGVLWLAPAKLNSTIHFDSGDASRSEQLCFVNDLAEKLDHTLAIVAGGSGSSKATRWARTDGAGCIGVSGHAQENVLAVTLHTNMQPMRRAVVGVSQRHKPQPPILASVAMAAIGNTSNAATKRERIVGLPCDGCENVFAKRPPTVSARALIASREEPGERLHLHGRVVDMNGSPISGVIVYAYHTNQAGIYPLDSTRHGRLRGWVQTDTLGRYEFDTIRPGGYPGRPDPAHIHLHVIEPGRCTYYIDDVRFTDDPRLLSETTKKGSARGGSGVTTPTKDSHGIWQATRDIYLGRNVPAYEECSTDG